MFWLFAGDNYYPSSGLGDYVGAYPTIVEAEEVARKRQCDWYVIITANKNGDLVEVG